MEWVVTALTVAGMVALVVGMCASARNARWGMLLLVVGVFVGLAGIAALAFSFGNW